MVVAGVMYLHIRYKDWNRLVKVSIWWVEFAKFAHSGRRLMRMHKADRAKRLRLCEAKNGLSDRSGSNAAAPV